MNRRSALVNAAALGVLAGTLSLPAHAVIKWDFKCGTNGYPACSSMVSSSYSYAGTENSSNAGVGVKVSAWADTGASGDVGKKLFQGNAYAYTGGLGVQWRNSTGVTETLESLTTPEHSMDNCGSYSSTSGCTANSPEDILLLSFDTAITLSEVAIGWYTNDADITVLAYTGSGAPNLGNNTYSYTDVAGGTQGSVGLTKDSWSFIGNYLDLQSTSKKTAINPGGVSSSYWLIGAYNSRVTANGTDQNNDFVKLFSVSGSKPEVVPPDTAVPEPGSLLLLGMGLPLLRLLRRRGAES